MGWPIVLNTTTITPSLLICFLSKEDSLLKAAIKSGARSREKNTTCQARSVTLLVKIGITGLRTPRDQTRLCPEPARRSSSARPCRAVWRAQPARRPPGGARAGRDLGGLHRGAGARLRARRQSPLRAGRRWRREGEDHAAADSRGR